MMTAAPPVAVLEDVTKSFGRTTVIDHLSLSVTPGQIYGMIGPSGCGKTTTVRLLLGILAPDEGQINVLGVEPSHFTSRHREQIGYTPQGFYLYPTLSVKENANFVAGLYGVGFFKRRRRVREVLRFLELWDARKRLARDISGGMQRRLELACALIHEPRLLLVDEPTAGLDPVLREKIWDHLRTLCDRGATVVVTTQYIDEAVYCDTVAVLNKGRLAAFGTPDELRERAMGGEALEINAPITREEMRVLWALPEVHSVEQTGPDRVRVLVEDAATAMPAVARALQERGIDVEALHPHVPTFDEVFMKIVEAERD
jgi:ABC-2 type transport system ATP-binding protein